MGKDTRKNYGVTELRNYGVISHPSSVIRHRSSVIGHRSSVIGHPSSVIRHHHRHRLPRAKARG
ncbi:MAG: hypothetical protein ACK5H0_01900 [Bacteroidota bacterium]